MINLLACSVLITVDFVSALALRDNAMCAGVVSITFDLATPTLDA